MPPFHTRKTLGNTLACTLAIALLLGTMDCGGSSKSVTLNVLAAASLTDAITEISEAYTSTRPGVTILPIFASSGTLQVQIENGGACDVFVSAATTQMDNLQNKGLLAEGTRRNLLNNKVVLIVPNNSTLGLTSFTDLALPKVTRIAIGDPDFVPAGMYAQQAMELLGIATQVNSKDIVRGTNAREVLAYVESGNIDAGVVYATDALISDKVKVVASAPDAINAEVVYPAAIIKNSKAQKEAQDYLNFLSSAQAITIFAKYGFSPAIQ